MDNISLSQSQQTEMERYSNIITKKYSIKSMLNLYDVTICKICSWILGIVFGSGRTHLISTGYAFKGIGYIVAYQGITYLLIFK